MDIKKCADILSGRAELLSGKEKSVCPCSFEIQKRIICDFAQLPNADIEACSPLGLLNLLTLFQGERIKAH